MRLDNERKILKDEERGNILEQWTSPDGKTLVFDKFFNKRLDLYRDFEGEKDFEIYQRTGLDKGSSVGFTDQAIFGWKQAIRNRDPRDVGLENIVHKSIITTSTTNIIKATLSRSDKVMYVATDTIVFKKGESGFEALMGTVHATRTAQILAEYVSHKLRHKYV